MTSTSSITSSAQPQSRRTSSLSPLQNGADASSSLFELLLQISPKNLSSDDKKQDVAATPDITDPPNSTSNRNENKVEDAKRESKEDEDSKKPKDPSLVAPVAIQPWLPINNEPQPSSKNPDYDQVNIAQQQGQANIPAVSSIAQPQANAEGKAVAVKPVDAPIAVSDPKLTVQASSLDVQGESSAKPSNEPKPDIDSKAILAKNEKNAKASSVKEGDIAVEAVQPVNHVALNEAKKASQAEAPKEEHLSKDDPNAPVDRDPPRSKRELRLDEQRRGNDDRTNSHDAIVGAGHSAANNPTSASQDKFAASNANLANASLVPPVANSPINPTIIPTSVATNLAAAASTANAITAQAVGAAPSAQSAPQARLADPRALVGAATNEPRIASSAGTTSTGSSGSTGALTTRQEVRLVQRVLRGFEQLGNGDGQVKLRLHPPQLGSLQMTVRIDGSQVSAKLEVENTLAQDALNANLPKLREKLAEQGLHVEKFEVQVVNADANGRNSNDSSQTFFGQNNSPQDGQAQQRQSSGWRDPNRWPAADSNTNGPATTRQHPVATNGLDLVA